MNFPEAVRFSCEIIKAGNGGFTLSAERDEFGRGPIFAYSASDVEVLKADVLKRVTDFLDKATA